jgi:hypothetical protein
MRGKYLILRLLAAGGIVALVSCSGGGVDVGNPLAGTVSYESSDEKAAGAVVILAKRGADPGFDGEQPCLPEDNSGYCSRPIYFDTTHTDGKGAFRFDTVYPGSYTLVASCNGLLGLAYAEQRAFEDAEVELTLSEPATVHLKTYEQSEPGGLRFRGARVAGTGFVDSADVNGDILLDNVPAGELDLILYRSDGTAGTFPSLRTDPGCKAQLYTDPARSESYWTPHPCGPRDPSGRPYIIETFIPSIQGDSIDQFEEGKSFDLRLCFSHSMNALRTSQAMHGYSDNGSTTIRSLWWEGADVLYVSLCVADTIGGCDTSGNRFIKGVTYGISIDTTAETDVGVQFAHGETIRFVPDP